MAKRLIDANKAQAVLINMAEHLLEAGNPEMAGAVGYAAEVIGKQRTVDDVEVVHGRWKDAAGGRTICSNCGEYPLYDYFGKLKFSRHCPNCGARMDMDDEIDFDYNAED